MRAVGARVETIQAQTSAGKPIMGIDYPDSANGNCALGVQRSTLHRVLSERHDVRSALSTGHDILDVDSLRGFLFEKSRGPFDLIVIADGVHSSLRSSLQGPTRNSDLCASAALVGLLPWSAVRGGSYLQQYSKASATFRFGRRLTHGKR